MADKDDDKAPAATPTPPAPATKPDPRIDQVLKRLEDVADLLMVIARHATGNLTAETPEDFLA